jgi:hypothetical protein
MDEFIASRDESESALAAASALRDSEARSLAEEHYIQDALHKAFGRLLAAATDKVTTIVLDEMASKNAEIYALRSCLVIWRDRQAELKRRQAICKARRHHSMPSNSA